jgi:hypothetical protein
MLDREQYDRFRVSPLDPATLRIEHVEKTLTKLAKADQRIRVNKYAESCNGKPIFLATLGSGPIRVLMWSQMHGDEPTHTAVLLDLLSYLTRTPPEPLAEDILKKCTLLFIPMLNPDGAAAVTRFNAQGIDINRDARRLATPEGRALRGAVDSLKPQFGFNLHNQNAGTTVGKPPRPAAISVLAPPPDGSGRESPSMRRAKQMCAYFVEAVRPHAEGMISRYDDTFEPRAFGDTIQSLGTATMLVEAGGWPDPDIEPLTRLHFHGMLTTLHGIATEEYRDSDVKIYESLPESNSTRQLDWLISNGRVLTSVSEDLFISDLGIKQSQTERLGGERKSDGKIVDIGDLSVLSARASLDAAECLTLPGQLAYLSDWAPKETLRDEQLDSLLALGTTTIIGGVDLADADSIEAIKTVHDLPTNWGFVGRLSKRTSLPRTELIERVAWASAQGVLAIAGDHADEALWHQLDRFGLPLLQINQLPTPTTTGSTYRELSEHMANSCKLLNLHPNRGCVGRDAAADLIMFALGRNVNVKADADWSRLKRVLVSGETVWENGKRTGGAPGTFLRRT